MRVDALLADGGACTPIDSSGPFSPIVISQVYGGGGATYTYANDFAELHNIGADPVVMSGYSIQYASGSNATQSNWNRVDLPVATIPAGGFFLIQFGSYAGTGTSLPTPDHTDARTSGAVNLGASAGKLALMKKQMTIASGATCPDVADMADFIGYGTSANWFETAPAPAPSVGGTGGGSSAVIVTALRKNDGCADTNDNSADFAPQQPFVPRNSQSAPVLCGAGGGATGGGSGSGGGQATGGGTGTGGGEATGGGTGTGGGEATGGGTGTGGGEATGGGTASGGGIATDGGTASGCQGINASGPFSPVVISQVFGGSGKNATDVAADFIELHNNSSAAVALNGYSVQYAGYSGTSWNALAIPDVSIPAGGYFLIQLASGDGGVSLPAPDLIDARPDDLKSDAGAYIGRINMSGTHGKVALMRTAATNPAAVCPSLGDVADLVGFGSDANASETAPAPATKNYTESLVRANGGCQDTNNNSADFAVTTSIVARNSATAPVICQAGTGGGGGSDGTGGGSSGGGGGTSNRTGCGCTAVEPTGLLPFGLALVALRRRRRARS